MIKQSSTMLPLLCCQTKGKAPGLSCRGACCALDISIPQHMLCAVHHRRSWHLTGYRTELFKHTLSGGLIKTHPLIVHASRFLCILSSVSSKLTITFYLSQPNELVFKEYVLCLFKYCYFWSGEYLHRAYMRAHIEAPCGYETPPSLPALLATQLLTEARTAVRVSSFLSLL